MLSRDNIGKLVRVKPSIEEIIKELSDILGYSESTIRNTAILYGLQLIMRGAKIPRDDIEFLRLLDFTKRDLKQYKRFVKNA